MSELDRKAKTERMFLVPPEKMRHFMNKVKHSQEILSILPTNQNTANQPGLLTREIRNLPRPVQKLLEHDKAPARTQVDWSGPEVTWVRAGEL